MLKKLAFLGFAISMVLLAQEEERNFRLLAHVTDSNGPFQTLLIFENITDERQTLQVVPYNASGDQLPIPWEALEPGEIKTLLSNEYLGSRADSHFFVGSRNDASEGIRVTLAYSLRNGQGSPVYVPEQDTAATRWRFFSGDGVRVFDGFSIINLGPEATLLTVRQLATNGQIIEEILLTDILPVFGKRLLVLGEGATASFDRSISNIFEIEASQPIVVLGLQGDLPNSQYLWRNTLYPQDPQQFGLNYHTR